jgi:hypothetical protein
MVHCWRRSRRKPGVKRRSSGREHRRSRHQREAGSRGVHKAGVWHLLMGAAWWSSELWWEGHHEVKVRRLLPDRAPSDFIVKVRLPLGRLKL